MGPICITPDLKRKGYGKKLLDYCLDKAANMGFGAVLFEGNDLLARGEEGINGLTISNAIHLSAWTGETVDVKNFPDDRFYELLQEKIKNSTVVKKVKKVVANTDIKKDNGYFCKHYLFSHYLISCFRNSFGFC